MKRKCMMIELSTLKRNRGFHKREEAFYGAENIGKANSLFTADPWRNEHNEAEDKWQER